MIDATATLPSEFTCGGAAFRQLKRVGQVALFKRTSLAGDDYFEVVVIKLRKGLELGPNKSGFWTHGHSYKSLLQAERRFAELIEQQKEEASER